MVFLSGGAEVRQTATSGVRQVIVTHGPGQGFVRTGQDRRQAMETAVPGLFAIGDVRAGSIKRVAAAVGEGAQVVSAIHAHLASRAA